MGDDEPEWMVKKREYEQRMARVKNAKLRTLCSICSAKAKLPCPCGTAQYCTVACQKVDWRERGHKKVCKEIRARAEAPTPPPAPPREVFYGPAPRSHADEIRARIAAEHEEARLRREADPEPEPISARLGSRCPICMENWGHNFRPTLRPCCCRTVCQSCDDKIGTDACPLCRMPCARTVAEQLARLRRHAENDVPEAIGTLGSGYENGTMGLKKSTKKAAKLYKRAVELGNVPSMTNLGALYASGDGVKLDMKKATQLYRMASDKGSAMAAQNLGGWLADGPPDARDHVEAFKYFKLAADRGLHMSFNSMGFCYEYGEGVERDLDEARRWYTRATNTQFKDRAMQGLARLDRRARRA